MLFYIASTPIGLCIDKINYESRVRIKIGVVIIITIKDKQFDCSPLTSASDYFDYN